MDNADHAGLTASFDIDAGTGNGCSGGNTAEKGDDQIADALPDQFLVSLKPDASHV